MPLSKAVSIGLGGSDGIYRYEMMVGHRYDTETASRRWQQLDDVRAGPSRARHSSIPTQTLSYPTILQVYLSLHLTGTKGMYYNSVNEYVGRFEL